jgi:hypothetical protein
MITKENQSTETLKELFETAFFDCRVDGDGDLVVVGDYRIIVKSNPMLIQMIGVFATQKGTSRLTLLEAINKMNMELSVPRAYALSDGFDHALVLDFTLPIGDGITPKTVVESFRFFESCIRRCFLYFEDMLN